MADNQDNLAVRSKGAKTSEKKPKAKKGPKENQGSKLTKAGNVDTKDRSPTCLGPLRRIADNPPTPLRQEGRRHWWVVHKHVDERAVHQLLRCSG